MSVTGDSATTGDGPEATVAMTADELLELAELHHRFERSQAAAEVTELFDTRYGTTPLTTVQRARRADLHGLTAANANDLAVAEIAWMSALDLFTEAGDELRRQIVRSRLGQLMCRTDRAEIGVPITQDATDWLTARGPAHLVPTAYRRMAFAYMLAGRVDEALANNAMAAAHAHESDDPRLDVRVAVDRAGILAEAGQLADAREAAVIARDRCREVDYRPGRAAACWIIGRAAELMRDLVEALEAYDEARSVVDDPEHLQQIVLRRAGMLATTNRAADALDDLRGYLESPAAEADPATAFGVRHALAVASMNAGRPLDCAEIAEDLIAGLPEGDLREESVRHLLAQAYQALDQPEEAIAQLELVAASGVRRDSLPLQGEMAEQIGDILDRLDRDASAAERFVVAARFYRLADMPLELVRALRRHATSLMWARDLDRAVEALAEADLAALDLTSPEPAARWERAMLVCDGARIIDRYGDRELALLRVAPAASVFRQLGDVSAATYAAGVHGDMLMRAERPADAEPIFREAVRDAAEDEARARMAYGLAQALAALGRQSEAAEIRREHNLGD